MKLRVLTPTRVAVESPTTSVVAESPTGSFGILPRHLDYVSPLVPGILIYREPEGRERYVAVDRGTLVKRGQEVRVAVQEAIPGEDLDALRETVRVRFRQMEEGERLTRSALAQLEAQFIRSYLEQRRFHEVG